MQRAGGRGRKAPGVRWLTQDGAEENPWTRSGDGQGHFQTRHKTVLDTVAQAPVTAQADAGLGIPGMRLAQRLRGLGIAPAMNLGVRRLRAYAGDFGEGPQQLGFDALRAVFQVALRPLGAGLNGPAFYQFTARFGRFAGQPGDAVV